mmetsp:Transcript_19499/g.40608  ORF Transcript_19499/g.40608 Transcript_19499/m.40608 type:complete len:254 (+) Transcript_19499:3-764(+)
MSVVEREIMDAALEGILPPAGRAPIALVMWGGIGAGKSTASPQVLKALGMDQANTVVVDVDVLVQKVPEFRAAKGTDEQQAAYMKYRSDAKKIQKQVALAALEKGLDAYVEWTNEENLHALSSGESDLFRQAALEAKEYLLAVCLVECRDVEGILVAAREREKVDGRHIPEAVIRDFNTNRALHWFTALRRLEQGSLQLRAFVETRLLANASGQGLVELTGRVKTSAADEDAAQAVIDLLRARQRRGKFCCCW